MTTQQYRWVYPGFQMTLHVFHSSSRRHFYRFRLFVEGPRSIDIVAFKILMQVSSLLLFLWQFVTASVPQLNDIPFFNPGRNPCLQSERKITFDLRNRYANVVGKKCIPFQYPHKTLQTYKSNKLGQKTTLSRGGWKKLLNPT